MARRDASPQGALATPRSLARTHGAVLGRLCMALLGSQADADEATQETLLCAHRGMASYRGEGTVNAWLCGIARHVCAHALETRRRGRQFLEVVPAPDAARADEVARARVVRGLLVARRGRDRGARSGGARAVVPLRGRPAFAHERLAWTAEGQIAYRLKRPWPAVERARLGRALLARVDE